MERQKKTDIDNNDNKYVVGGDLLSDVVATFKQRLLKAKIQYAIRKLMRWDSDK